MATWDDLTAQYPALADQISQARATGAGTADQADAAISKMVAQRRQEYIKKGHAPNLAALNTLRDFGGISNDQIAARTGPMVDALPAVQALRQPSVTSPTALEAPGSPYEQKLGAAMKPVLTQGALRQQAALGKPGPRLDTSSLIDAAANGNRPLRSQLLSSEDPTAKLNRVAQPIADQIMHGALDRHREELGLYDPKLPRAERAKRNAQLVTYAMVSQNLLGNYAGDPNDLVDRGYITDKELQDYAQQTAGESKGRTITRGLATQMLPQLAEFAGVAPPVEGGLGELLGGGRSLASMGASGAALMAPLYAQNQDQRLMNMLQGAGLGMVGEGAARLPDMIPQTTDMAALRQLAGVPDMPRGPVGDAAGQSVRTPAVPTVPSADDVAKLFNFDADAKLAARRNKLRARTGQPNPIDAGIAGSPVEDTAAMKADVPGYSGLKDDKTGATVPTPGDITPNPANDPFEKEFIKQRGVLQQLSRQNRWFLPADQIDSIARLWAQKSLELDARPVGDGGLGPTPSMREDASALSRVEPGRGKAPTFDQRDALGKLSRRMNDDGLITSEPPPRKPIPDYRALALKRKPIPIDKALTVRETVPGGEGIHAVFSDILHDAIHDAVVDPNEPGRFDRVNLGEKAMYNLADINMPQKFGAWLRALAPRLKAYSIEFVPGEGWKLYRGDLEMGTYKNAWEISDKLLEGFADKTDYAPNKGLLPDQRDPTFRAQQARKLSAATKAPNAVPEDGGFGLVDTTRDPAALARRDDTLNRLADQARQVAGRNGSADVVYQRLAARSIRKARWSREAGAVDIAGLLDAVKKGGKGVAKAIRSWLEVNHGLTKDITKEPLQAFERDKNIATNHMERDLGELAAARVPADIQSRVVSSRALKGDLDVSHLAKYPKIQKMISKISVAIDAESAKYGAWLQAHGMNSAGIKDALGQWLHRTYSRLEPTDAVVAKNVRLFQRSRAFELPNGQVVPEGHGFFWRAVKDANGNIVEGAKNLGRRVTADEATNFAKDLLARKEDNYMPAIDRKGVGGTSIAKARTQMMNDPRIRMLRGEQKGLGVFVHSLEQIRMLNAKHQFIDSIMATEPKWDTWYPDRKPSSGDWVEMPNLKHLGDMAGKQVPKPIAELLVQHFGGLTGAGPDEVLFGGNSVTGQFNKLFNWWKFKNTVLKFSSLGKQAAQNFVNLVGSANSPMWPGNWKAHNMARRLLTTADAAKLADIPLTPEGVPILDQAAGVLGAASRAEFTGSLQRALDAGMDRADINPLSMYKKLTSALDKGKIKAEAIYNFFDQHAKLSTYIKARGLDGGSGIQVTDWSPHKILSHDDAVAYVNDMFINYQRPSKLVQWIRLHPWSQAILNPFMSYKVLNVPVLARAITRHPIRMGAMLGTLYGIRNLAWTGQDAEQIRKGIPDDRSFPMKWNIAIPHDYPATVDAGGLFPGAELGELASSLPGMPNYDATEGLGGNAYIAMHAFLLHNYLNGPLAQALTAKDREPGESIGQKFGEDLLRQTIPLPVDYKDAKELYLAIDGAPSMPGTAPRSKLLSTMNLFGARTQTIDTKSMMQKYNTLNSGGFTQKDLNAALMPIMMKLSAHEISPQDASEQMMRVIAHKDQIAQKVGQ